MMYEKAKLFKDNLTADNILKTKNPRDINRLEDKSKILMKRNGTKKNLKLLFEGIY